jgi:hypothetical protein
LPTILANILEIEDALHVFRLTWTTKLYSSITKTLLTSVGVHGSVQKLNWTVCIILKNWTETLMIYTFGSKPNRIILDINRTEMLC